MTEQTCDANDCIGQAEIQRYDRMKWGVLGLLLLAIPLFWLLSLIDAATSTAQEQREQIEVNLYVHGVAITPGASEGVTMTHYVPPPGVKITGEVEVPRIVQVTREVEIEQVVQVTRVVEVPQLVQVTSEVPIPQFVEATREVEVTRVVPVTREVEITRIVPVERVITVTPTPTSFQPETPTGGNACTRFDFEEGRDKERGSHGAGRYEMREVLSGRLVAVWDAEDGWLDSGWLTNRTISRESVHVSVLFFPAAGGGPIEMEIINPAPGTTYGWLSRGICHAIEIQFPPGF